MFEGLGKGGVGGGGKSTTWREMPVIWRQIGLCHNGTSFHKKIPKKKTAQANTRLSSLELEVPRSPSSRTIMEADVFSFRFFLGRSVQATS